MIRFRRIFDLTSEVDRKSFHEAAEVFRLAFPYEPEGIERIRETPRAPRVAGFHPVLLVSTDTRHRVTGLAFVYYFPDLRYGCLQYIAGHQQNPARGIGAALYEALRELLGRRRARGLFLDVPPADLAKLHDKSLLSINLRRLRFYSRYSV